MPRSVGIDSQTPNRNKYIRAKTVFSEAFGKNINLTLFAAIHVFAFLGLFFVEWSWKLVTLCIGLYYLRMFGITAGYHRYFSHRTYKLDRIPAFIMALIGSLSLQKGVLWWASHHRYHHKFADTEDDIHSPTVMGFLWSHCGWFLLSNDHSKVLWPYIPDLAKRYELILLERYHMVPGLVFALFLYLVGGYPAFFWGFIVSIVLCWHGTYTINSLSHVYGKRRYDTPDTSRNNWLLSIITLGEGWHNNHHAYQHSARNGFFWYEFDPTYYILFFFSIFGIVRNMKPPAWNLLDKMLIKN